MTNNNFSISDILCVDFRGFHVILLLSQTDRFGTAITFLHNNICNINCYYIDILSSIKE